MFRHALEISSLTHQGMLRAYNEDSVAVNTDVGLAVLADGMGGHRAGDVASQTATQLIVQELKKHAPKFSPNARPTKDISHPAVAIQQVVREANSAIRHMAQSHVNYRGMGTTIALALFYNNVVTLAHVGDSRIYRVRQNRLQLLTKDDSLLREQVDLGIIGAEDARHSNNRSIVTRALGVEDEVPVGVREEKTEPGDIFLLCSDGLNDMVEDADIELIIRTLNANLPLSAHHLVQAANDNGGLDNISVILVKVIQPFPSDAGVTWPNRLFRWFS